MLLIYGHGLIRPPRLLRRGKPTSGPGDGLVDGSLVRSIENSNLPSDSSSSVHGAKEMVLIWDRRSASPVSRFISSSDEAELPIGSGKAIVESKDGWLCHSVSGDGGGTSQSGGDEGGYLGRLTPVPAHSARRW